ncbi:phage tail tube protein [Vibrio nomapromontoriensis]|uniref:phage tail tube protein n=1 Tax=Vibrio nomapromontoriensis TaxID=2910246 RepID=UPI003D0EBAC5
MARKYKKKVLAFAVESTYGVDAIAAGSPIYCLGREFTITPMAGESQSLDYDDGQLGNKPQIHTEKYVTVEFTVDMAASSAAGTPAPWADLMKACLRKVTSDASTSTCALHEEATDSLTLYFYMDGALHKLTGARGSLKFSAPAKNFGGITFSFTGLFAPAQAAALPTPNFSAWVKPLKIGVENSAFTIDGTALKLISLEYDQANAVEHTEYVGHEEVQITDYAPTSTIVIEAPPQGTWDAFALSSAESERTLVFTNGPVGNQFEWSSSKVQLGRPTYGDQSGTTTLSIPLNIIGNSDTFITR